VGALRRCRLVPPGGHAPPARRLGPGQLTHTVVAVAVAVAGCGLRRPATPRTRHYCGAYSDAFLDGDVVADRRSVWSSRLSASSGGGATVVAEGDTGLAVFAHVVFDEDSGWGSLVDNLHVAQHRRLLTFSDCLRVVTMGDPCGMPVSCGMRTVGA
jgi:hypothetical protein